MAQGHDISSFRQIQDQRSRSLEILGSEWFKVNTQVIPRESRSYTPQDQYTGHSEGIKVIYTPPPEVIRLVRGQYTGHSESQGHQNGARSIHRSFSESQGHIHPKVIRMVQGQYTGHSVKVTAISNTWLSDIINVSKVNWDRNTKEGKSISKEGKDGDSLAYKIHYI